MKEIRDGISISTKLETKVKISEKDKEKAIKELEKELDAVVKDLDFEKAIELRDKILELKGEQPKIIKTGGKWKRQSK